MFSRSLITSAFLFLILVSNSIYSQQKCTQTDSLHTFNFYLINGYALSYNLLENEHSAFRLQLDFSSSYNENKEDEFYYNSDNVNEYNRDRNHYANNLNIKFSAHYLKSIYNSQLGKIYLGGGPFIGINRWRNSYNYKELRVNDISNNSDSYYEQTGNSYSVGLTFVMGVKSYFSKTIFIFAEAHLNGGRTWNNSKQSNMHTYNNNSGNSSTDADGTEWFYNLNAFRLGIGLSL